jgi:hypothetical protein
MLGESDEGITEASFFVTADSRAFCVSLISSSRIVKTGRGGEVLIDGRFVVSSKKELSMCGTRNI